MAAEHGTADQMAREVAAVVIAPTAGQTVRRAAKRAARVVVKAADLKVVADREVPMARVGPRVRRADPIQSACSTSSMRTTTAR
jgi:hypothetical protein